MRMLPSLSRRGKSTNATNTSNTNTTSKDHRRSWHMGTGSHEHHHEQQHKKSSKRKKGKQRGAAHRATWHIPRLSRHSLHHHPHGTADANADAEEAQGDTHTKNYELIHQQERKTFSYAHTNETATRAPSPPSGETAPTSNSNTAPTDNPPQMHQKKDGLLKKIKRKFRAVETFFFPGCHPLHSSAAQQQAKSPQQRVRGGVLLASCLTAEEHKAKVRQTVELAKTHYGQEGLKAIGLEYRFQPCQDHPTPDNPSHYICQACAHRLFHIETNTPIDSHNRKLYVADGDMYDAIARLCMQHAHQVMENDLDMMWITLSTASHHDKEPIRALVNRQHWPHRPTLLIVTGKGKVRAGIFSRQHSLVSGLEPSTAMPLIYAAQLRHLNLVILDPNCHGDKLGMATVQASMAQVFQQWEQPNTTTTTTTSTERQQVCKDLYILSHSASGAQLARYLLDHPEAYLPHIQAIAFTDATHNIQWARQKNCHALVDLLQSPKSIYFKCSTSHSEPRTELAGALAPTDKFWQHRFGTVKTCWAGTKEHSLTNWYAHTFIWNHFDQFLGVLVETDTGGNDNGNTGMDQEEKTENEGEPTNGQEESSQEQEAEHQKLPEEEGTIPPASE